MPADILRSAVRKYLGLNLDQIPADRLPAYTPTTNCYYTTYNGAAGLYEGFTVTSVTVNDGTVQIVMELSPTWTQLATLQITDEGYCFLSIVRI